MSAGSNHEIAEQLIPQTQHKSAGLAFLLSLFLPGAGQLYCGKRFRGLVTLCFSLLGAALWFLTRQPDLRGTGLSLILVLWIFSFLDAYFAATEINSGQDLQVDAQNPRVAVTLNLLTAGFGYFYLGERTKGMLMFMASQLVRFGIPRMTGYAGGLVSLLVTCMQMLLAVDAYRIARMQLSEALGPPPEQTVAPTGVTSRLPAFVPITLACFVGVSFFAAMIVGLALGAARGRTASGRSGKAGIQDAESPRRALRPQGEPPSAPTDFLSAVGDVRKLERKTHRTTDDIQDLKRDGQILASAVRERKLSPDDEAVAHFYKAHAFSLINSIHDHEGEEVEVDLAKESISEFDKVIASNPHTYIPAANASNAEYYAGLVARNHLRSIPLAYKYWEKCAWQGHAGCLNILANARFTGDGGEKMDINEALDLHTMVFNTGVQSRCAAASSALSIAKIVHFTGVHRAGDDELEWVNKSYSMMDKLGMAENNKNVCDRAEAEIEEFLFRLSRGQRKPSILQDAAARVDGDSPTLNAVIQMFSGSASEAQFEAQVQSSQRERDRCTAYFDAMWYAHLTKRDAIARHYRERMSEIGDFHCGLALAYASKLNP